MPDRLDPIFVRREIDALAVTHPGIWEDDELRAIALESETNLREFLEKVVRRMLEADAFADGIAHMIDDIKARQQRFVQRSDAMHALAFRLLQQAAMKKLELPQATLYIRAGTPKVIITDETALPPDCVRIKREPDKIAIRDHLARGEPVPGAELSNAEPVLAMRVK